MYQTVNGKKAQYEQIVSGMEQYGSLSHCKARRFKSRLKIF